MIIGNRDVTNPLEVIECIVAFDCKDYSVRPRDRMLYVIVFGWDDESFTKFGWDKETIDEYKELHKRFKELSKIEFGKGVAEALQQPQVGGWIPVSERPPKETGNYLVTSKGSTWVANWFNGTWWGIEKKCRWTDIEAWQPLPEPYKESEEK